MFIKKMNRRLKSELLLPDCKTDREKSNGVTVRQNKMFTLRGLVFVGMFLSSLLVVSCFGSQSDEENLEVSVEETANATQGQTYEDNQIALAGGNELTGNEGGNELSIGNEVGENQMQEQGGMQEQGNMLSENDVGQANTMDNNMANIAEGNDANVLAEAGSDQNLTAEQGDQAIANVIDNNVAADAAVNNAMQGNMAAPINSVDMNDSPATESFTDDGGGAMATSTTGTNLPEMGSRLTYVVVKGDTLGKISEMIYGDKSRWRDLAAWSGFANPHLIYPGNLVYYQYNEQSAAFAQKYEGRRKAEVVVQAGDTLSTIAARVYGNPSDWVIIWRYNGHIANPDRIEIGQKIHYPEDNNFLATSSGEEAPSLPVVDSEPDQATSHEADLSQTQQPSHDLITVEAA